MIAGIVLVALGVKKTIGHVDEPLDTVPAVALFGGIALYYAAHVAFRLRNLGSLNRERLVAVLIALALIPLALEVDALIALALRGRADLGADRVRGDSLPRGPRPYPPRAREHVTFTIWSRKAGDLLLDFPLWQARWPSSSAVLPTTRSSTECSRRPGATSSSRPRC